MELEQAVEIEDERKRSRLNYSATVLVETVDKRCVTGTMRDIGLHSLYLFTEAGNDDFIISGEPVRVKVTMSRGSSNLTIELDGHIGRMDDEGFVIKFSHTLKWWPVFTMFPMFKSH